MNCVMCFVGIAQGEVHHVLSINHAGKNTSRSNNSVQPYFTWWGKTVHSFIFFILIHIIQWMINNPALLWSRMHASKLISHTHTHLNKIPPHTHHTPLHTHMILHTTILLHTHLQKILPCAHNIPLHNDMIIHKKILMRQPITHTRKYYSYKKLSHYPHFPQLHFNTLRKCLIINASCNGTTWYGPRRP